MPTPSGSAAPGSGGEAATTPDPAVLAPRGLLVDGAWRDETTAGAHDHVNPATGRTQAPVALAGEAEVDEAVAAADRAQPSWRALRPDRRREILLALADALRREADTFTAIAALETGIPVRAGGGAGLTAEYFSYYAGWADKIEGRTIPVFPVTGFDYTVEEPYGTVATVIPWNGPLVAIGMKVAPALAAGNAVVLKPSELSPFAALRFGELAHEAGLPPGVLNVIPGDASAGDALVRHPGVDKISFTGGAHTAKQVMRSAADTLTPLALELGGKSANLIFADADFDAALAWTLRLGYSVAGQGCVLPTRVLVHDDVHDDFVAALVTGVEDLEVGDPFDPATVMGPVISEGALDRILATITRAADEGSGRLLAGGGRLEGPLADGFFVEPTLFGDVDPSSDLAQEEIFGPVVAVSRFTSEDEAIALANGTRYGLGGYLHTSDLDRAHRVATQLDAGYICVNGFPSLAPPAPFGGFGQSGFGREGGRSGLDEFLRTRNVYVATPGPA